MLDTIPEAWGLMVDRVSRMVEVTTESFFSLPSVADNPSNGFFKGVVKLGDDFVLYLTPERLHPDAMPAPVLITNQMVNPQPIREKNSLGQANGKSHQILLFSTSGDKSAGRTILYGLSLTQVLQVLDPLSMISVPACPPYVLGLANWRNRPVPVIDLDTRLGLESPTLNGRCRLLIARRSSSLDAVGFHIRPNIKLMSLPIAHRPYNGSLPLDKSLTRGVFELEGETLVVPSI